RLQHLCDAGGAVAAQAALAQMALAAGLYAGPVRGTKHVPEVGAWLPEHGVCCPVLAHVSPEKKPLVLVVFYRSYLVAADLAPVEALCAALRARGFDVFGLFAPSLKAPGAAAWGARQIAHLAPAAIVNATSFSGRGAQGTSPLDAGGVPVFQVALATSTRTAWAEADRGLSPADLAMHVVLPEVDGRLFAGVTSFKEPQERDPDLQFARVAHVPDAERIAAAAERVARWIRLAATPASERRLALVLSTYPGRDWNMAHAVGLDALASAKAILEDLSEAGYGVETDLSAEALSAARLRWPLTAYKAALQRLPKRLQDDLETAWGAAETDPDCVDGTFSFRALRRGAALVALQPERGSPAQRDDDY
ncbi:unnamed protein product, partial [Ectocarpus sp. 12 AP-2014]